MNTQIAASLAPLRTTLTRDFSLLLSRRAFWWFLALWAFFSALIFFTYLENFLAIQPTLRAKNFRYGVTDIVIIPYLTMTGTVAMLWIAGLCSRLFYHEQFSPFSLLYRSLPPSPMVLLAAKWLYIALLAAIIIVVLLLPVLVCAFWFDYNGFRVMVMSVAVFMLLLSVGGMTMLLSQLVTYSVLTVFVALLWVALLAVAANITTVPMWAEMLAFFSPLSHIQRLATGVFMLSDGVFFVLLIGLLSLLSLRQYRRCYHELA